MYTADLLKVRPSFECALIALLFLSKTFTNAHACAIKQCDKIHHLILMHIKHTHVSIYMYRQTLEKRSASFVPERLRPDECLRTKQMSQSLVRWSAQTSVANG